MSVWNMRWANAVFTCLYIALLAISNAARSQTPPAPFKPEELEALVAPIALYPDSVLSQVLMASTYPLEIVRAARWVKANPKLKGDAAVKAVEKEPWDVSVKSLVAFPQILEPMNDKLDWTQKLGDAFIAQQKDVFAAVQRLRARAEQSGNLKSNEQQTVKVETAPAGEPTIVRIEPANPQVIYVPAYNPTVVYGAWSYPAYPPYYWPPPPAYYPGAALATGFAWGVGLAAAGAIFSNCNWGNGDVNINVNKAANIDRSVNRSNVQGNRWQHDASHRQGVAYRDNATREKYSRDVPGADSRNDFRGRSNSASDRASAADRAGAGNRATTADRAGVGDRAATADRAGVGDRAAGTDRAAAGDRTAAVGDRSTGGSRGGVGVGGVGGVSDRPGSSDLTRAGDRGGGYGGGGSGGRDNAFQGVGAGNASQHNADRGRSSMQSSGFSRGGGGMRGGGGGGGGGGRR